MSNIVQISDFGSGRNRIATNSYQTADLQSYIDKWEKKFLISLLGKELYDLFIADLSSGVPTSPIYQAIFNELYFTYSGCEFESEGMKEMLKGVIYFYYTRDQFSKQNTVGVKQTKGENSNQVSTLFHDLYTRYNNAGNSFEAIQMYIYENSSDYPTFNGAKFEPILPL